MTGANNNHAASPGKGISVEVRNACKAFGTLRVLDDVSLSIRAGEFLSILGPSGSGKTTLLNAIAGFARLDSGAIRFGDRDVSLTPPHKRDLGVVFQNYALFPHMDVGSNVAFPLAARRIPKAQQQEKVKRALELVELDGYQGRAISQLSGGQRQRVALARAIVFEPSIILMDEPLSALDKRLRESMQFELRRLHKHLAATIIYVTHDQREALTMSDRIVVMRAGKLVQVDAPRTLYEQPANAFVADFVGESILVPVQRVDAHQVRLANYTLRSRAPLPASESLRLVVPAEKLLFSHQAEPGANRLSGTVRDIAFEGESLRIEVALNEDTVVTLRQPTHHAVLARMPQLGQHVELALHAEDTVVVADEPQQAAS